MVGVGTIKTAAVIALAIVIVIVIWRSAPGIGASLGRLGGGLTDTITAGGTGLSGWFSRLGSTIGDNILNALGGGLFPSTPASPVVAPTLPPLPPNPGFPGIPIPGHDMDNGHAERARQNALNPPNPLPFPEPDLTMPPPTVPPPITILPPTPPVRIPAGPEGRATSTTRPAIPPSPPPPSLFPDFALRRSALQSGGRSQRYAI